MDTLQHKGFGFQGVQNEKTPVQRTRVFNMAHSEGFEPSTARFVGALAGY